MDKKVCRKCGTEKPVSEFYWRKDRGFYPPCKSCHNMTFKKRHNDEYRKEHRKYMESRKHLEVRKATDRRHTKKYALKYPEKERAKRIVGAAIRRGIIKRLPCRICGASGHAHHEDYSRPLEVIFLCRQHHSDLHNNRLDRRSLASAEPPQPVAWEIKTGGLPGTVAPSGPPQEPK